MIDITHLVVNGCSWTYGQGLNNPKLESWPALLSKKLDIPLVNLAIPGSGNDSIFRRTTEYFFQNLSYNSKPLVIIAWSQLTRREGWLKKTKSYEDIHIGPGNNVNEFNSHQLCHLENYDMTDHFRRNLIYQLSLKSLLTNFNIPYINGYYSNNTKQEWHEDIGIDIKNEFNEMYDYVHNDDCRWDLALSLLTKDCKKLSCGHEDREGHLLIADYIFNFIQGKFKLQKLNKNFLKLNNFKNLKYYYNHNNAYLD